MNTQQQRRPIGEKLIFFMLLLGLFFSTPILRAQAQTRSPKIYACVLSTKNYIVGFKNPPSGLFVSADTGATFHHMGWENIRCFGFAMHPKQIGKTFFLASGNGVFRTEDGGQHWRILTDWHETEIQEVLVNPRNPRKIVIGTPYGIFRSEDGGQTWQLSNSGLQTIDNQFVSALAMDRTNPDHLLLGSESGIFESTDGGKSWTPRGLKGKPVLDLKQDPFQAALFYAGTDDFGIFRSFDGGKSWRAAGGKLGHKSVYVVTPDPTTKGTVYAGTFEFGVYKSTDFGKHWRQRSRGLTNKTVHALAVFPGRPNLIFAGTAGGGIFRSRNGGNTWQFAGLPNAEVWDIQIW